MPRQILKLPKKPAASTTTGDARSNARKPIRGGSQASKRASNRRTDGSPATSALPTSGAGDRPNPAPRFKRDAAEATHKQEEQPDSQPSAVSTESSGDTHQPPQRRSVNGHQSPGTVAAMPGRDSSGGLGGDRSEIRRPDKPSKKTYPPRGIARSTGARALPPTLHLEMDHGATPAHAPSLMPKAPARQNPQTTQQPDPANLPTSTQRGLAKESPRLSKLVSQLAQCSRREADEWIENGWVSVDGAVINRLGARVNPKAQIKIKENASHHATESVSIVFHKPRDLAGGAAEEGRESVALLIRPDNRWAEDNSACSFRASHLRGLTPAGKLEPDETGMLAFTQEGSVARRLTGGDSRLEKEYHVRVDGDLAPGGLELLRQGLSLDNVKLKRAQVSWLSDQQLRFVMHESRKSQIHRMCEAVGLQVTDVKRVRIGSVSLGKLPPGQWRYLRTGERF